MKNTKCASDRQRTHLVALVRAGATFRKGQLVERPTDQEAEDMVA